MDEQAHCWRCGAALDLDPREPVGRREACTACDADIRSCRGCAHFEPNLDDGCREPAADRVAERDRANFCGWFRLQLGPREGLGGVDPAADAKRRLEALFGGEG